MKLPISINDGGFVFGMFLLAYGLYGWYWQIAAIILGIIIMLISARGALGERMNNGNTRKDA